MKTITTKGGNRRQGLGQKKTRKQSHMKTRQNERTRQNQKSQKTKNKTLLEICKKGDKFNGLDDIDAIRDLIRNGANVNVRNNYGETPLHLVISNYANRSILSAILLDWGADPNLQDFNGRTPLHIFIEMYQKFPSNSVLYDTTNATLRNLLDMGADVNIKDKKGKSSFSLACIFENIPLIIKFLQYGADINTQDNEGKTPLYHACDLDYYTNYPDVLEWNINVISTLLMHGADPNIQDKYGMTALFAACDSGNKSDESLAISVVNLLLSHGANTRIKDKYGFDAAHYIYNAPSIEKIITEFQNEEDYYNLNEALINQTNKMHPEYNLRANVNVNGKKGVPSSLFNSDVGNIINSFVK